MRRMTIANTNDKKIYFILIYTGILYLFNISFVFPLVLISTERFHH